MKKKKESISFIDISRIFLIISLVFGIIYALFYILIVLAHGYIFLQIIISIGIVGVILLIIGLIKDD